MACVKLYIPVLNIFDCPLGTVLFIQLNPRTKTLYFIHKKITLAKKSSVDYERLLNTQAMT